MKKTLYIRIDSSPLPEEVEGVIYLDCNLENYFCAHLGRVLCHGLKAKDGTPYYCLFQPGALVADYKKVEQEKYCCIIRQWENILRELLHEKPDATKEYTFTLPNEYKIWLLHHDDKFYREVGKNLTDSIILSADGLCNDVISVLFQKVKKYLLNNKSHQGYLCINNKYISADSFIVKLLKETTERNFDFLPLSDYKYVVTYWDKNKFFPIYGVILGETNIKRIQGAHFVIDTLNSAVFMDNATHPLLSDEWFCCENTRDTVNLHCIKRHREMPSLWKEYDWDWCLSYNEWIDLLSKMRFEIYNNGSPIKYTGKTGQKYFHAEFEALTEDHKLLLTFQFGNEYGGETEESKNTLNAIITRTFIPSNYASYWSERCAKMTSH